MQVSRELSLADRPQMPNFLPVALSYFRGEDLRPRSLLTLRGEWVGSTGVIPTEALVAPVPLVKVKSEGPPNAQEEVLFIGPPAGEEGEVFLDRTGPRTTTPNVGLVDVGIAFWHPAFRREDDRGTSVFETMLFMEFAEGGPKLKALDEDRIRDYCALFDSAGQAAVIRELAVEFPGSIYGNVDGVPGLGPGDFAHGTAMASRMLDGVKGVTAVGLELPAAAVSDRSGDTLRPVASMAVQAIATWFGSDAPDDTDPGADHIHIAMPYAYLGGPAPAKDGKNGPVHQALEAVLGDNTTLYLPTGNLRQERQHIRFGDMAREAKSLIWQIPAEDPTANTVELCWKSLKKSKAGPEFTLHPPAGDPVRFGIAPDQVLVLSAASTDPDAAPGPEVGAAHLRAEGDWHILRLTLAPTRVSGPVPPALAGQWRLTIHPKARMGDVHGFILRDDPPFVATQARRTRQSRFVDKAYVQETTITGPATRGPQVTVSPIKRDGTVSHLVLGTRGRRVAVSASEGSKGARELRPSLYAGFFADPADVSDVMAKDVGSDLMPGVVTMVNGTGAHGRVMGTSMAVALAVRGALWIEAGGGSRNGDQSASSKPRARSVSTG